MKIFFLSLAIFSAIVSCSDDDVAPEPTIVGTWRIGKSITYQTSTEKTITQEPNGCNVLNTIDFSEYEARLVRYAAKDNKCVEDFAVTMKYSYNPQTKKMKLEDDMNISNTVIELTKMNMVIEERLDIDMDGVPDIIKTYFTKVK
ncbi:Lipocalin-like domain-containing protein [Chryseobacterium ureilyticum]|uniref:Lipocalin-like domain-containing protein n=1 Tax=Chryseobacterium ureilyticum TaxID=373668 RepID=A0A1N7QE69_9FLAO|nr:lipocalin family protein [Chryseobacterium ureilyticum]SIT21163.1 Lipocalin-like domain-containing protein [Chryseobacterium ureilyticum]